MTTSRKVAAAPPITPPTIAPVLEPLFVPDTAGVLVVDGKVITGLDRSTGVISPASNVVVGKVLSLMDIVEVFPGKVKGRVKSPVVDAMMTTVSPVLESQKT